MKVSVDPSKCQAHGLCGATAPDVFDFDDDGYAIVLTPDVAPEHQEAARRAVAGCPESAILSEQ